MKKIMSLCMVLLLLAMTACSPSAPKSNQASTSSKESNKQITIAGNGGKIEKVIREEIAPKFEAETGIKVNYLAGLSGEILSKLELQKNAPKIDIALFVPLDVYRANEKGLIDSVDETSVPNLKNLDSKYVAFENLTTPVFGLVIAPAYNTKTFEQNGIKPIESWNDLARADYRGKTAFADISNDWGFNTLYSLALANGGNEDNLEPGLKKAKELAGYSATFYKNSTQMMPALQQGAADVTVMGSYVTADLAVNSGVPLKMVVPKEGVYMNAFNAGLVKNTPNKEAAIKFINYLISEEAQKATADQGFYPVVQGISIPEKYEEVIGLKDTDKIYTFDIKKLAESRAEWTDRWSKEVTPQLGALLEK